LFFSSTDFVTLFLLDDPLSQTWQDESGGARREGADASATADAGGTDGLVDDDEEGGDDDAEQDDEAVRLEELLTGLAVDDDEAARGYKVDHEDEQFLSGKFVYQQQGEEEDQEEARQQKQANATAGAAAAAAFLSDPTPPKFAF
jgi:hypothetical protein